MIIYKIKKYSMLFLLHFLLLLFNADEVSGEYAKKSKMKPSNVVDNIGLNSTKKKMNLLFIMFDDLKPELSIYGKSYMNTPNFERLANRSVIFDYCYCQVAVCAPSRYSLMTGIRPDKSGVYGFNGAQKPHLKLPIHLSRYGYKTRSIGKIFHWEDNSFWTEQNYNLEWYKYQAQETMAFNASSQPDKQPEENFRDSKFTKKAIEDLRKLAAPNSPPFMLGLGFKLPHLEMHVPYKYYEQYKDKKDQWQLKPKQLRFPEGSSILNARESIQKELRFLNEEGQLKYIKKIPLDYKLNRWTNEMRDQLMYGYLAGISFVDKLMGDLFDELDKLNLWNNTMIVLTSDHGMHNGEKGIWNKWSVFEESTRVPLMIYHPNSPYGGRHVSQPVELVDVYPTVMKLLDVEDRYRNNDGKYKIERLSGYSLVPAILGDTSVGVATSLPANTSLPMAKLNRPSFAISQLLRCIPNVKNAIEVKLQEYLNYQSKYIGEPKNQLTWKEKIPSRFGDCPHVFNIEEHKKVTAFIGYSLRTSNYRYIAWYPLYVNTTKWYIDLKNGPYHEDLYSHANKGVDDFSGGEVANYINSEQNIEIATHVRELLTSFIKLEGPNIL